MKEYTAVEILLVEDNPRDAELILRALNKNNLANNVLIASDGAEALDFFFCRGNYANRDMTHYPKIVLLDLKLPKVSGLELLKIVKEDDRTSHIPIVVLASSAEVPDIEEAYSLGANGYVVKPVDFDQFSIAMNRLGLFWLLVNQLPNKVK
jgi:two-component system response regulator